MMLVIFDLALPIVIVVCAFVCVVKRLVTYA